VRLLPAVLAAATLPEGPGRQPVPIGVGETDLAAVHLDLAGPDPHFLVFGDGESGKTTFLRTFLTGLAARYGPDEARVLVVDYRRTLLEVVPDEHLLVYAGAAPAATDGIARLRQNLVERLPGPELSAAALRDRSWWTGPEAYVVVDDHDLVVTPTGNPLSPLLDLLPQARDIGLHLVVARRAAGASRAMFEPVLQRLKEMGTPGLVLSGDRAEGPLLGTVRATEQPPGRGVLVRRKEAPLVIQVATTEPEA
jgi:S-DNA-T family DNA segregation ATPase FtsK/SpoIIIE